MADKDKEKKEQKSDGGGGDLPFAIKAPEDAIFLLFGLIILGGIIERLSTFVRAFVAGGDLSGSRIAMFVENSVMPTVMVVGFVISVISVYFIAKNVMALGRINREQNAIFNPPVENIEGVVSEPFKNQKWERVMSHMNSQNPSDWKFAILEADIILDELLDAMGYRGETMADKLKKVEPSDFETIDYAWEAHKVRNVIAHEGADYIITEREARRVIELFRKVFLEFHYI